MTKPLRDPSPAGEGTSGGLDCLSGPPTFFLPPGLPNPKKSGRPRSGHGRP